MNSDDLNKCMALLAEISDKYGLQTNIQVQCADEGVSVFIAELPLMCFSQCAYFLKYYDTVIQCIDMQKQINDMNIELNKMLASMRC